MNTLLKLIALSLVFLVASPTVAEAKNGWLKQRRVDTRGHRQSWQTSSRAPQNYSTRRVDRGTTRLPSGRNYYQGRYYGNFNNRFYGPQYGYF